jgi:hypothetical protein
MAFDPSVYEQLRRELLANYSQQASLNAYQQFLQNQKSARSLESLNAQAFGTTPTGGLGQVPKLTSSYAQGGLQGQGVKSGLYNRALSQYGQERAKQLGYAQQDIDAANRGFDLTQTNLESNLRLGEQDIEARKARQIADDARALLQLR